MADYALLVDGDRVARAGSDHAEDDPSAAHVQIIERGAFAWLTGGKLVDSERFR